MEDHNSPEAAAKRASQEDPIIMYLIVRETLNMSIGKTAAQVGHATGMLHLKYQHFINCNPKDSLSYNEADLFESWLDDSFRKVVLRADEKEWAKIKKEISKSSMVLVVDAGLTELEPNTETVIGLLPMRKSDVPKVIKRLQVLK